MGLVYVLGLTIPTLIGLGISDDRFHESPKIFSYFLYAFKRACYGHEQAICVWVLFVGFALPQSSCAPRLSLFLVEPPIRDVRLTRHQNQLCSDLIVAIGLWHVLPSRLWFLMDFEWLCSNHKPDFYILETSIVLEHLSRR